MSYNPFEEEVEMLALVEHWREFGIEYVGPMRMQTTWYILPSVKQKVEQNDQLGISQSQDPGVQCMMIEDSSDNKLIFVWGI